MYAGHDDNSYRSNIPLWPVFIRYLEEHGLDDYARLIGSMMPR